VNKFPILGDIPILGTFFRSKQAQQNRTELMVLVTPHIVQPSSTPPPIPTGEPETWDWDKSLRESQLPAGGK
jgi:Flp pilus assembly secretin CpaC